LTHDLAERAKAHLREVEELGGMTKAIEAGLPKLRIEESAARTQARIDAGRQVIVGVNRWKRDAPDDVDVLRVDNARVLRAQQERLAKLKAERDGAAAERALAALTEAAKTPGENLLARTIDAARAGATVGEMALALERVFGRHSAAIDSIAGVYGGEMGDQGSVARVRRRAEAFAARVGRRPRELVAQLGQDGHDRGQKIVASALADLGFDVDIGALFKTPEETAREAIENDVHVIGVSSLAAGHLTLVPALRKALEAAGRGEILVIVGGVVPRQDHDALRAAGCVAIFGPGTPIPDAANELLDLLERARS
jgi:methylmalonyl-CoA mutase